MTDTPEPPFNRLDPLNAFLFEKLFGEKGDEAQLLALLKPILARTNRELDAVTILDNKDLIPDTIGNKKGILDIRGKLTDGSRCNIEVQRKRQLDFVRRSLFYLRVANSYRPKMNR